LGNSPGNGYSACTGSLAAGYVPRAEAWEAIPFVRQSEETLRDNWQSPCHIAIMICSTRRKLELTMRSAEAEAAYRHYARRHYLVRTDCTGDDSSLAFAEQAVAEAGQSSPVTTSSGSSTSSPMPTST
jgi:hypothetical protein